MAEKKRKKCGESVDGGKDAENVRRIYRWRERYGRYPEDIAGKI